MPAQAAKPRLQGTVIDNRALNAEQAFREEIRQQLVLADLLYEGQKALAADRLMTPPEDSALARFNRVLALQPGNPVALQGIQDVAGRYLQLAETASRQGQFDNALLFLQRAAMVADSHPGLPAAREYLAREQARTQSVYTLSAGELASQSASLMSRLQEIAALVRDTEAFLLITAPSDAQGRWIYAQMQAAVQGYRLRGDIEIGEQPSIRLVNLKQSKS
ncbi:MAG: hypothetical protein RQ757_02580 [Pseudomonadales bacterium]|nr:hypothetical protein [Pseudomonadales bacterium]